MSAETDKKPSLGRRMLEPFLVLAGALYFLIEDVLWNGVIKLTDRVARLEAVAALERRIAALPPYVALALLAGPAGLILPVKLGALYLIATGHAIFGVALIIAAKMVGTALAARIFHLTRPKLITIAWFRRLNDWVLALKARLYGALERQPLWLRLRSVTARIKEVARGLWRRAFSLRA